MPVNRTRNGNKQIILTLVSYAKWKVESKCFNLHIGNLELELSRLAVFAYGTELIKVEK